MTAIDMTAKRNRTGRTFFGILADRGRRPEPAGLANQPRG